MYGIEVYSKAGLHTELTEQEWSEIKTAIGGWMIENEGGNGNTVYVEAMDADKTVRALNAIGFTTDEDYLVAEDEAFSAIIDFMAPLFNAFVERANVITRIFGDIFRADDDGLQPDPAPETPAPPKAVRWCAKKDGTASYTELSDGSAMYTGYQYSESGRCYMQKLDPSTFRYSFALWNEWQYPED